MSRLDRISSQAIELLVAIDRGSGTTLGSQVEDQLKRAIRDGSLKPGARVPSTRDLARQLGISRRIAVEAYSQLSAEGYLSLRQGARPRVSDTAAASASAAPREAPAAPPRYDLRPSVPDVSAFPRAAWLRSVRKAVNTITDADLGYGDMRGVLELRTALTEYLGRVRGVVADASQVIVTCGYSQGLGIVARALAERGATRIALEDPSYPEQKLIVARGGLEHVPVPVDELGLCVGALPAVDAVVVAPAHQHPTGVVLAPERRTALLAWLREHEAVAIEDDYDDEYRYDRAPVGALQGLDPDRVIYAGSVSKTLAPALRLGWLVVPHSLVDAVAREKELNDRGTARIEQLAFADFLARGELDRHLRRMRAVYRSRREALISTLAEVLPEAEVLGIAAGFHVTVRLPDGHDHLAIAEEARRRRIELETLGDYMPHGPPTLMLGYAQTPEPAIRAGIRELAAAIAAVSQ